MIEAYLVAYAFEHLPQCWADRSNPAKAAQEQTVIASVAQVSDSIEDAAALLALGNSESRFCLAIHEGKHRGKGRGPWQIEEAWRWQAPDARIPIVGLSLEATTESARVALAIWDKQWHCGPSLADRFTGYAGRPCGTQWKSRDERVKTYWYMRALMLRAQDIEDQRPRRLAKTENAYA